MASESPKHIYVIGLDTFNREQLEALPDSGRYRIHELLSNREIKSYGDVSFGEMLARAEERLDAGDDRADGLVTWWDFPATSLLAILTSRRGLPGPSLESTLKCEHKYWSRCVQREVAPDAISEFAAIDPFAAPAYQDLEVKVPFWLKPIKGTDSMLGFKVNTEEDYSSAISEIREHIGMIAEPFNEVLAYAELPEEISRIDGRYCLAESILEGSQHTVTGYVHKGKITTYGVVDSINYPDSSSFFRYEYPSFLTEEICERMNDISRRLIERIGLNDSAFNIEFFYDEPNDVVKILEVNPRISQSHSDVFLKVDGKSDESLIVELALDEDPVFYKGHGDFNYAAKFYYRRFEDGVVRRVPDEAAIKALRQEYPNTLIHIEAEEGKRLSESGEHDSYSFALAILFVGADSREDLLSKYQRTIDRLPFEIE